MAIPVPVIPGRRGHRGVEFAPTKRLRELHRYYRKRLTDPDIDPGFHLYCRELTDEIDEEMRRRNRRTAVAA
jgi:hypothetical protein